METSTDVQDLTVVIATAATFTVILLFALSRRMDNPFKPQLFVNILFWAMVAGGAYILFFKLDDPFWNEFMAIVLGINIALAVTFIADYLWRLLGQALHRQQQPPEDR